MGTVAVIGEGRLAGMTAALLSRRYRIHCQPGLAPDPPAGAVLVLLVSDDWRPLWFEEAEVRMREAGTDWIGAAVRRDEAIIGPHVRPGMPGCSRCADTRMQLAEQDREELLELRVALLLQDAVPPAPGLAVSALRFAAMLLAAEAARAAGAALEPCRVRIVNMRTLESSSHSFLPDPFCPCCGGGPDDSPESAEVVPVRRAMHDPGTLRTKPPIPAESLAAACFDERTGLFNAKRTAEESPVPMVAVSVPTMYGSEVATGRSRSFKNAFRTAMLEGLERYCGVQPRGKRTVVRDSYHRLAGRALNPVLTGVYSEEQYASEDFPFEPFDPDRQADWVWGYSLLREEPVLVPERMAYYGLGFDDAFVQEGSNGCALGSCPEEAILHGMLEIAERDAFLMAWYAGLPLPRIDPRSSGDSELDLLLLKLRATGYDVLLYDATTELGIPCLWAIARSLAGREPNLVCAAGAHPDPVRAAKAAVYELAGHIPWLTWSTERMKERALAMLQDSALVTDMADHSLVYALREAEPRLHFLLGNNSPAQAFGERFARRTTEADLSRELDHHLNVFRRSGLDVIAVDQTAPETLLHGLYCMKVIVPGALPMSFGHRFRRLEGLDRLLRIPAELGYADGRLMPDRLNPYPHPFL